MFLPVWHDAVVFTSPAPTWWKMGFSYSAVAPKRVSRSLLPANLLLFSRHLQLPIPLGLDLLLAPGGEHVLWRDVANRAVQANVVVMIDVASTRRRASSNDSGVPGRMHSPSLR